MKKLKIKDLEVKSFVTTIEAGAASNLKGAGTDIVRCNLSQVDGCATAQICDRTTDLITAVTF